MGLWQRIFGKSDEELAQIQAESAENMHLDLRLREGITLLASSAINRFAPSQDSPQIVQSLTNDMVNMVMTDYNGTLQNNQILASMDKEFLPQPSMLAHWAESKGFQKIEAHDNTLSQQDIADKYVLTYYPPAAKSWAKRTGDDVSDTTNKHWYSHTKSALYDSAGQPVGSSNPEAFYNDSAHDAAVYVPEDSVSYAIDYKKLGLQKDDIAEGFKLQNEGMNIMDPKIQESVFRLKDAGLSSDDVVKLWRANADITNEENLNKIENTLKNGKNKDDIFALDYVESNNEYHYNLQDKSCAIQPTAPVLYATSARIKRENLNAEQADKLRKDIGLYNIYDEKNYGEINKKFYGDYESEVFKNFKDAIFEDAKKLIEQPKETLAELGKNAADAFKWLGAKTLRWAPHATDIVCARFRDYEQSVRTKLMTCMHEDSDKFKIALSSLNPVKLLQKYLPSRQAATNTQPALEAQPNETSLLMQKRSKTR